MKIVKMKMIKQMHPLRCITIEGHHRASEEIEDNEEDDPAAADSAQLLRTGSVIVRGSDYIGGGSDSAFTVAGMLYKWTNYHKGWRSRWFILRNGVISYAKTRNRPDCVSGDDVTLIGGDDGEFPSSSRRSSSSSNRKSAGIVHLKISSFRESRSDDRRFYVFTCTKTLHLKTNSKKQRADWVDCLTRTRSLFSRRPPLNDSLSSPFSDNISTISTDRLKKRLLGEGINEGLIKDCEQIMLSEFSDVKGQLKSLCDERSTLLDTLRQFEATNTEGEASGVNAGGYRLMKNDYPSVCRGKYGEWSTTESSDDVEKQELEEVSDEEETNFFDAYESFSESTSASGVLVEDHMDKCVDLGSRSACVRNDFSCLEFQRRKKLPDPVEKEKGASLWSVIKDNVGKDLTRVCLPVYFNEPLSTLQKCFEEFEYSYLLDRAYEHGKTGNSLQRILHVAAFAVSGYSSTEGRQCKPFNPLLGETYEADYPEKSVRFFSEKVSHHPTIIACHCEGRGWKMWCDSNLKSKFWGRSIQLDPVGTITLEFDDGEIFQWSKVTSSIYNLILGKLYIDHSGTMHIRGNRDYSCKLKFKEPSILERNPHQVHGFVEDCTEARVATLFGKWNESMYFVKGEGNNKSKDASLLWERDLPPRNLTRYNLSSFAITLNELTPGLKEKLPPTDSRLRPDQRYLENGEYDKANAEKLRLETRQRMSRKLQEDGWKPRWFERDSADGTYRYTGGYWESGEHGNWDGCSNIFSEDHGKSFEGS